MATWWTLTFEGEPTEADFQRVSEMTARGFTSGQLINEPGAGDEEGPATGIWAMPPESALLLCDGCWEAATGLLAGCADFCGLGLSHLGLCDEHPRPGAPAACQNCGRPGRLHEESTANIDPADLVRVKAEREATR